MHDTESLFHIEEEARTRGHSLEIVKEHCRKDTLQIGCKEEGFQSEDR